ncbi:DUF3999 family protein [Undibacterium cyanobacteriorum]|uniref:DUF3999 family protein n=1 Tax=Undibacterium cyanobacteriorum TaxID=3073561 RepID=A0ABY9RKM4_9BURK|nr:DUF3999 family protein [Undibacterium sp. 20NA77.5]WMW80591.1 DUF3999 family protein [Undibacterium sp. 20NA77.5]
MMPSLHHAGPSPVLQVSLGLSLLLSSTTFAATSTPVRQAQIQLPQSAPAQAQSSYHSVALPLEIYATAKDSHLSDVRVRNAAGEYLSYAWLGKSHQLEQPLKLLSQSVPIFPVARGTAESEAKNTGQFALEAASDGSLRWSTQANTLDAKTSNNSNKWIIDASALIRAAKAQGQQAQLVQLRLQVDPVYSGVAGFTVEASDDLQHWRPWGIHAQLVQLQHQNDRLEQTEFALPGLREPYLRLSWDQAKNVPQLLNAKIDAQYQEWSLGKLLWTAPISASRCEAKMCEYDLPPNLPIDSVRVRPQSNNVIAQVSLFGVYEQHMPERHHLRHSLNPLYVLRHQKRSPASSYEQEDFLNEAKLFRLQIKGETIESDAISSNGASYKKIRLRVAGNGAADMASLGTAPPQLEVGSIERQLVFLARGAEPFRIEWGGDEKRGAAMALAALMPPTNAVSISQAAQISQGARLVFSATASTSASTAASSTIASVAASTSASSVAAQSFKNWWLWLLMLAAVGVLGWMVWTSLASMDAAKSESKDQAPK